jgi:hypothetical protein
MAGGESGRFAERIAKDAKFDVSDALEFGKGTSCLTLFRRPILII